MKKNSTTMSLPLLSLTVLGVLGTSGCHEDHVISPTPPTWLDAKIDQTAKTAAPDGQKVGETYHGVAQQDDEKVDWTVQLDAQHCYLLSGQGDENVQKLSLYAFDPIDKRIDSRRADTNTSLLKVCPEMAGPWRIQGKVAEGYGHFGMGVYAIAAAPKPAAPPPTPAAPPPADLASAIESQATNAAPGATRVGGYFDGSSDFTDWFTSLDPGNCYWFIGAGEQGKVKKLSIYLWDPQNKRLGENRSESNTVMVGHCPTSAGMYKFEAKVESGSGPYKVGVFSKKK